ncbi:MAG: response regulator transcription factor [Candidatus Nanopelagicales bacterium]
MISVVLVDDHEVVVQGLRILLAEAGGIEVVGSANDGRAGVALVTELRPDVVLMDLSMPGLDGVAATRQITEGRSGAAVVILTTFGDRDRVLASLDAGAVGYLMKDAAPQILADGVRAAASGGSPIDPRVARTLVDNRHREARGADHRLTAKQVEVLTLVAEGLPNRLVARRLGISEKTVKAHLTQIYTSLGVTDRVQAALWAQEHLRGE